MSVLKTSSEGSARSKSLFFDLSLLVVGMALCFWSAWGGGSSLCVTRGCELYRQASVAGLSFHVLGVVAFALALVVRLLAYRIYLRLILACLWGEVLLLVWQVLSAPCSECLIVGFIWGLLAWLSCREPVSQSVWAGLWATALVVMVLELAAPWPIYGQPDAPMKIFFSPNCESCQIELNKLAEAGEEVMANVALYPIARNEAEVAAVGKMVEVIQSTGNIWMAVMQGMLNTGENDMPWLSEVGLRLRLISNKLLLGRMGVDKIPVALSYGFEPAGGCGVGGVENCDKKKTVL